jgi:prophage antirepressor-like protein
MSNKLKEAKQVVKKTENLQQKYAELNELNWKTHNDLKRLQADLERMMRDYTKIEESSMQQQSIVTSLEQTCQDLKEQ